MAHLAVVADLHINVMKAEKLNHDMYFETLS
jgi:hypothetical protein